MATIILSDSKSAVHTSMAITRDYGTVVQVAQPKRIDFSFEEMIFRDIRLIRSNLSSSSELADKVQVDFVVCNNVETQTAVFHGLESLSKAIELSNSGKAAGNIVVVVDSTQVNVELNCSVERGLQKKCTT